MKLERDCEQRAIARPLMITSYNFARSGINNLFIITPEVIASHVNIAAAPIFLRKKNYISPFRRDMRVINSRRTFNCHRWISRGPIIRSRFVLDRSARHDCLFVKRIGFNFWRDTFDADWMFDRRVRDNTII